MFDFLIKLYFLFQILCLQLKHINQNYRHTPGLIWQFLLVLERLRFSCPDYPDTKQSNHYSKISNIWLTTVMPAVLSHSGQ